MKKWMYNALIVVFAVVFLVSAALIADYFIEGAQQENRYDDLSGMKENVTPRPEISEGDKDVEPTQPALVEVTDPETGEKISLLPDFADLYLQNNDIVGWLTIPGTKVDYPVMQTPEEADYYLYRDFDKKDSKRGCLYTWPVNDVLKPSDNITIYGHHMRDGSMFGELKKFRDPEFFKENRYIFFDSLTELHTYEVMAVFLTTATDKGFAYHAFIDAQDEAEFDKFVEKCHKLSLYDTGVTAEYGDKLICLSTCEYSQTNGRLVVVAKRVA